MAMASAWARTSVLTTSSPVPTRSVSWSVTRRVVLRRGSTTSRTTSKTPLPALSLPPRLRVSLTTSSSPRLSLSVRTTSSSAPRSLSRTSAGTPSTTCVTAAPATLTTPWTWAVPTPLRTRSGHTLNDVRYGRSCDPDNTVDMGGSYTTENKIKTTFTAGDKFASVSATSMKGDKYEKTCGSTSQLVYASVDKRAVPAYGNSGLYPNKGVFSNEVNTPHAKNKSHKKDAWIGMFVKFGNMAPGAENPFYFDTWMAESKVVIDEAAVAKASVSIAKVAASEGCAAIPCPAKSTGPDVRSGCKCNKSGKVTPTKSAPFYSSTCA